MIGQRAKDRPAYSIDPNEIALNPERAVFDIHLLRRVGEIAKLDFVHDKEEKGGRISK